ncbi:PAX-interacting protein 1 [Morella rubra]|uniref:PAX-interacting protein 1 n=1 Tax=Morella rubra TaxID=262757 RepID=A0A6A1VQ66_9ROSI|nr:PAX-interacting protein 1 [Morella rubra]
MCSLGDHDGEIKPIRTDPNVSTPDIQTQFVGSQFSSPSISGEKVEAEDADELNYLQNTMPFDDTEPAEDEFETRVVNLAGETQVLNICGETQVLDDADCIENMGTQLLDELDKVIASDFGSEGTEILGDSDVQSDDDSERSGICQSVDREKIYTSREHCNKGSEERPDPLPAKEHSTSPLRLGFTSVRVASLRASALAARVSLEGINNGSGYVPSPLRLGFTSVRVASLQASALAVQVSLEGIDSGSGSVPSENHSLEVGKEVDHGHEVGQCDRKMKGSNDENICRVGSRTARKLFSDDSQDEYGGLPCNSNNVDKEELPRLPACDAGLAGLSYVDSQEPGELSQDNALDFVDRFLKGNIVDFDQDADHEKTNRGKSCPVSNAKGIQSLAKKSNDSCIIGEAGIFDWDDSREDEGGGDIFRRRKEEFLDSGCYGRRYFSQSRKPKGGKLQEYREHLAFNNKRVGLAHSDSKLMWHKPKAEDKGQAMKLKRNLVHELDKQPNDSPCGGESEINVGMNDVPEMLNVGFDTQMAAEAMEALFHGEGIPDHDANDAHQGMEKNSEDCCGGPLGGEMDNVIHSKQLSCRKRASLSGRGVASRQYKKPKSMSGKLSKEASISSKGHSDNFRKGTEIELVRKKLRVNLSPEECTAINGSGHSDKEIPKITEQRKAEGNLDRSCINEFNRSDGSAKLSAVKKLHLQEVGMNSPVAHRTRRALVVNQLKEAENAAGDSREEMDHPMEVYALEEKSNSSTAIQTSIILKGGSSISGSVPIREVESVKPSQHEQLAPKLTANISGSKVNALNCPRQRRSHRNLSGLENGCLNLDGALDLSVPPKDIGKSVSKRRRSWIGAKSHLVDSTIKRKTQSGDVPTHGEPGDRDGKMASNDLTGGKTSKRYDRNSNASCLSSTRKVNARLDESPREKCKPSDSACTTTPVKCQVPENSISPVCMGDEYFKISCKRNLSRPSLLKEIRSLSIARPEPVSVSKDSRKRRDMTDVRVLYSHHLDEDVIKQQKKILARLGISLASSVMDATHFIADQFVRTRNMLEAIASGKPVVTHLWLESCGQASCFIDERNYILRDSKKEKEFGFTMPVSLARASQHPLLKGQRVLITPNTKPGKEIISSLVKVVQGQVVERTGQSRLKDNVSEDFLVLSCEEDYAICVPFLEKGAAVYSSELLLNGIVTQRLEYQRHRLFADNVKRTRSTIWIRKDDNQFLPVKHK